VEAGRRSDASDFAGALAQLDAVHVLDPHDERVVLARRTIARRAAATLLQQGEERLAGGDIEGALQSWQALVALCPKEREAHAAITRAGQQRAAVLAVEAAKREAAGDLAGAVDGWRQVQSLAPSEEAALRLREAEIGHALEVGRRLYQERRYPEAAFQFRKVLAQAPEHEEAQRYLGYTQSMRAGSTVTDRFSRLE
jgi:tetratricopeptide (TPR) repeat protein